MQSASAMERHDVVSIMGRTRPDGFCIITASDMMHFPSLAVKTQLGSRSFGRDSSSGSSFSRS